jgi:hypothetical protein
MKRMILTKRSKVTVAGLVVSCLLGVGIGGFQVPANAQCPHGPKRHDGQLEPSNKKDQEKLQEKLDRILNRLEDLDRRLRMVERKLSDPAKASLLPTSDAEGIADVIKSLLRSRLVEHYSSDPSVRMKKLLDSSKDYRQIMAEWHLIWWIDHPLHLKPERVHGGIQ